MRKLLYRGGVLYGGIRKLAYFLNGIRRNYLYFGGFRKTRILSDTENCILKEGIRQSSNLTDTDIA